MLKFIADVELTKDWFTSVIHIPFMTYIGWSW